METSSLEINSKIENYHKINNYEKRKNILYENHPICTRIGEKYQKKETKKYNKNVLFYHGNQNQILDNQHFMNAKTTNAPIFFDNRDKSYLLSKKDVNDLNGGDLRETSNLRINNIADISKELNIKENYRNNIVNPFLNDRNFSSKKETKTSNIKDNNFRLNMGKSNFPINNTSQFVSNFGINTREKKIKVKEKSFPDSLPKSNNVLYGKKKFSNPIPIDRGKPTQNN